MKSDESELRKAGLKVTGPRLKVLQFFENHSESHFSAEDVYQALKDTGEDVGIATVYRVLTQFETAGLLIRHNFDNGPAIFELDSGEHHDHMVCTKTGKVIEFHSDEIEALQDKIAAKHGYEIVGHSLVLYVKPKA